MKWIVLSCILFLFSVAVLAFPDAGISATPPSPPAPTRNVYQTIASRKDLDKFAAMINQAGLKDLFTGEADEPVTVFVPDNQAIDSLSRGMTRRIEASKASLQSFIKYHVIADSIVGSGAIRGRNASPAAANGETLQFDGKSNPPKVNDATLVETDVQATNGIIHIVSTALVPPSLQKEPLPAATPESQPAPAPIAATTTETPAASAAAATTSGTAAAARPRFITTGVAKTARASATIVPPAAPSPPATDNSTGFTLFGHKFNW